MMGKAMIAMSGGVDSSVAAYLMQERGFEIIGVTMHLFDNEDIGITDKTCCSLSDTDDARSVAARLGIPFYVLNFKEDFRRNVIDRFVSAYAEGKTPNPCIDCNRYLKFGKLITKMRELGFDYVVTGHYARISFDEGRGRYILRKAKDAHKDQSYVLYSLTQEQLSHVLLPLGELTKPEVR
ncbi:MAG: tRNA 2-thiouridine(34) synthase MnmA, partial [Clostridia bacterium]|nr:tRNA 2-thiouridine(34) synthase MnmA [Clostridia bacterium]